MPRNPTPWRIGFVSLTAGLLLVAGLAFACRGDRTTDELPRGVRTHAVALELPAGASVVVSGYDLEAFWTRLQGTQLYRGLAAVQGVREAFAPLARTQREFEAETGLSLDEKTVMNLFGRKFELGYYGPLPEDRADLLLVAQVDNEDAARQIVNGLEQRLMREKGVTFRDEKVARKDARVATNREEQEVLFYTLGEDRLAMSTTRTRMEEVIELTDESQTMADVQDYVAVLSKLPEATITLYVDQRAIAEASRAAAEADTGGMEPQGADRERLAAAATALEEYNLVRDFGVGVFWTEKGIRSDVFTRFLEDRRPELTGMLTRAPTEVRSLAFQPERTLAYGAVNTFDAQLIYDQLTDYAVGATRIQMNVQGTPDSLRADSLVMRNLRAFEQSSGINIEADLLAWMGEEASFSLAGVNKNGFFPLPEFAIAIASKDERRARAFFEKAEGLLADAARRRMSVPVAWQGEDYQGQTIRSAPTPLGEGLAISYVVTPDFVIVASNPALAKRMLDARTGRSPGLPSNPDFAAMTEFYAQRVNAIGFVNLEQVLTEVQGLMGTFGPMTGSAPDTTSTTNQVLDALKNAPRLGLYAEGDGSGLFTHVLLEVR